MVQGELSVLSLVHDEARLGMIWFETAAAAAGAIGYQLGVYPCMVHPQEMRRWTLYFGLLSILVVIINLSHSSF
jgi:hypothetical protein